MKIHHTNRTMNATFNLKRFLLLEQYKRNETGRHLLWSAAVVSFICILCILYDINRGGSYYGKHTSATEFSRYVLWFILMAPCLLETNFSKHSSTLDILLPAAAFEKFLHIWIKYLLLLPLFCSLLIACLKGLLSLSGSEILQYFADGLKLRSIEADCIYAGIMIDTNNFTTRAGVRTFEAAAFLRRCGADVTRVRKMLRDNIDSYKARAEAVRTAEIYRDYFAIARCPSEGLESPTVVGAQAANELLNIAGVKASFVLTSYNNEVYISARAIDEVNVQVMMERMGGGGHLNFAGAQVKDTMDETERMLKEIIDQLYQEGERKK